MNSYRYWIALCVGALVGCSSVVEEGDEDLPNEGVSQALTSFTIDSSALEKRPVARMPATYLQLSALEENRIAQVLLGTNEKPQPVPVETTAAPTGLSPSINVMMPDEAGSLPRLFKTSDWEFEKDELTGLIMGVSQRPSGPEVKLDPAALEKESVSRLMKFGVGDGEIGRVLQRQVMAQDGDDEKEKESLPRLHSHKTFVFRGINGVQVVGHRAVISHAGDGSVRKVAMHWPALSKSGHLLRSPLSTREIEGRAVKMLAAEGELTGKVFLYWRYVPVQTSTGEVVLKLSAAARLEGSVDKEGMTEEPRIVDVDVDATL